MVYSKIFLITIDALRADHTGNKSNQITPALDYIASRSQLFTQAYANGPGTNQSLPSLLTSVRFLNHNGFYLSPKYPTLAEILKDNGYYTIGYSSNPFLSSNFFYDRGFDEFYDFLGEIESPSTFISETKSLTIFQKLFKYLGKTLYKRANSQMKKLLYQIYHRVKGMKIPYVEGETLNKRIKNRLDSLNEEKLFVWIHYMDTHYPYIPPKPFLEDFDNREDAFYYNIRNGNTSLKSVTIEAYQRLYAGEVKYVDHCIGQLYEYFKENNYLDDSLIIITSDHGEAFNEHQVYGHRPYILYNEVLHVPLIINGIGNGVKEQPVQLLDIPPTILDLCKIQIPKHFQGKSIVNQTESNTPRLIFSESANPNLLNLEYDNKNYAISCIFGKWKYITNKITDKEELYDISQDYQETRNLITEKPRLADEFREIIKENYPDKSIRPLKEVI